VREQLALERSPSFVVDRPQDVATPSAVPRLGGPGKQQLAEPGPSESDPVNGERVRDRAAHEAEETSALIGARRWCEPDFGNAKGLSHTWPPAVPRDPQSPESPDRSQSQSPSHVPLGTWDSETAGLESRESPETRWRLD
jgi:hypothetical protein